MIAAVASVPAPTQLFLLFAQNAALFAAVALIAWGAEAAWRALTGRASAAVSPLPVCAALSAAGRTIAWVAPVTIALSFGCNLFAQSLGFELPRQELVLWLKSGGYSPAVKAGIVIFVLFVAPLSEELVFRRFLFRWFSAVMPGVFAALLSAAAFAVMHGYLAVMVPIMFLGTMFALAYRRTGRLLVPMAMHSAFNALNVVLVFVCPDLA